MIEKEKKLTRRPGNDTDWYPHSLAMTGTSHAALTTNSLINLSCYFRHAGKKSDSGLYRMLDFHGGHHIALQHGIVHYRGGIIVSRPTSVHPPLRHIPTWPGTRWISLHDIDLMCIKTVIHFILAVGKCMTNILASESFGQYYSWSLQSGGLWVNILNAKINVLCILIARHWIRLSWIRFQWIKNHGQM